MHRDDTSYGRDTGAVRSSELSSIGLAPLNVTRHTPEGMVQNLRSDIAVRSVLRRKVKYSFQRAL